MLLADVIINISLKQINKTYLYIIPTHLSFIAEGWRVLVPFGGRKVEGFIIKIYKTSSCPPNIKLKEIISSIDDEAWFLTRMIDEAKWFSEYYLCPLAEAMSLFIPGKSGIKIKISSTIENGIEKKIYLSEKREKILYEEFFSLSDNFSAKSLTKYSKKRKQKKLLEYLQTEPLASKTKLKGNSFSNAIINALLLDGMIITKKKRIFRNTVFDISEKKEIYQLTYDQKKAYNSIEKAISNKNHEVFLLHGITGSGKTQVYIKVVEKVRKLNKQAIILVPEIALTGQMVSMFKTYFKDDIVVLHSRLSLSERNDAIFRLRQQEANIVIGPRSALFVPFNDIGAIIIDEEHDTSYKQENFPPYNAKQVAYEFSKIHNSILLLGSATPSIESFFAAKQNKYKLLTMLNRIDGKILPNITIVDMREELKQGNRRIVSKALESLILKTLNNNEQIIIMLNRRGHSTFIMCRNCGYVVKCPSCNLPMVYHLDGNLSCHHCGIKKQSPIICPNCKSTYIKYFGTGTEKLEQELNELVPTARIIRMDKDTTKRKFSHLNILKAFSRQEYDILLGTQMVAKGHDFPNVTAVGIISADSSLNMPDFRAAERCFTLITQTAGRAGRGEKEGRVIVQTYNTIHYAIKSAEKQNYNVFYETELSQRKKMLFPPYCKLIKFTISNQNETIAQNNAFALKEKFKAIASSSILSILGPIPAMIKNLNGFFRFILILKATSWESIQPILKKDNIDKRVDITIDIDPISLD